MSLLPKKSTFRFPHLAKNGADVDMAAHNRTTPLCIAAERGHLRVVHALLDGGADKNRPRTDGQTPLSLADTGMLTPAVAELIRTYNRNRPVTRSAAR